MKYTPRQLILYIKEQGYSDQAIADALGCSRVTITNVRLEKGRYTGTSLYRDLMGIVRNLQAQEPQEVVTPVAAPPQVVTPAWVPKVKQEQVSTPALSYCKSCPFNALIPGGLSAQQTAQWAKTNECSNKKSGNCPR